MTNIQLAWENADLAKAIYKKHLEALSEGSSEKNEMVKIAFFHFEEKFLKLFYFRSGS
jgi:hypothetical protein